MFKDSHLTQGGSWFLFCYCVTCLNTLIHNIYYVDTIKIIKYLKVLQHVSDHTGSIIREPCTVLG